MKPILEIQNLEFKSQGKQILAGITLNLQSGEVLAIVGHNGAGKTTLFHLALGLKFPTAGSIRLQGHDAANPVARNQVSFVPERPYLNLYDTGEECVSFYKKLSDSSGMSVDQALEKVGLTHAKKQKLKFYSKGMLQRTLMAQALVNDPVLLILDEPMSGLDPEGRTFIRTLIQELKGQGKSIIFSTHTLEDVQQLADRVLVLDQGQVKFMGTTADWSALK